MYTCRPSYAHYHSAPNDCAPSYPARQYAIFDPYDEFDSRRRAAEQIDLARRQAVRRAYEDQLRAEYEQQLRVRKTLLPRTGSISSRCVFLCPLAPLQGAAVRSRQAIGLSPPPLSSSDRGDNT